MTSSDSSNRPPAWEAIARHHAGEAAAGEAALVERWLALHPGERELLASVDLFLAYELRGAPDSDATVDVERALARLHRRMDTPAASPRFGSTRAAPRARVSRRSMGWLVGGFAAAVAVAALTLGLPGSAAFSDRAHVAVARANPGHDYRTAVGVIDSVMLSDGTRIILAPQSHLVVAESDGQVSRDVTLEGVAQFSVRHDVARPFAVHAGAAVMEDVGTTFIVRAPSDATLGVTVTVSEGEVRLSAAAAGGPATSLRPGDRAVVQMSGLVVARHGAAASDDAWTRGLLVYHDAPLELVRDDMRRWYGIDLQVDDATLASKHLTASFERGAADAALRTIALAFGATIERAGRVATLRPSASVP